MAYTFVDGGGPHDPPGLIHVMTVAGEGYVAVTYPARGAFADCGTPAPRWRPVRWDFSLSQLCPACQLVWSGRLRALLIESGHPQTARAVRR